MDTSTRITTVFTLVGLAFGAIALLEPKMTLLWSAIAVLSMCGAAFYALHVDREWAEWRRPKEVPKAADASAYETWDLVDPLRLADVACLWAGVVPTFPHPTPEAAVPYQRILENEVIKGALRVAEDPKATKIKLMVQELGGPPPPHGPDEKLTRDELRRFFKTRGEFPAFLFPEKRNAVLLAGETPKMAIVFDNEANENHLDTLFKVSSALLPEGVPMVHQIAHHQFYVAVENKTDKTVRGARVVVEAISPMTHAHDISLSSKRTGKERTDIQPGSAELFLLGEGYDHDRDAGITRPRFLTAAAIDQIANSPEAKFIGLTIRSASGARTALLKNDSSKIELTAYADDVAPATAILTINARTRLEVFLNHQ